jgi:hypothetical protein
MEDENSRWRSVLAVIAGDVTGRRTLREAFRTYLASYSLGLLRYLHGDRVRGSEPIPSAKLLGNVLMPTDSFLREGLVALSRAKREEPIGWISASTKIAGAEHRIIVPLGAIFRSVEHDAQRSEYPRGRRLAADDIIRYILPQLVDVTSEVSHLAVNTLARDLELRLRPEVRDAESYERFNVEYYSYNEKLEERRKSRWIGNLESGAVSLALSSGCCQ